MAYTTINKSTDHFNTKLYTGTGSSNALTGVGFQPDWTWIKRRNSAGDHELYDAVRGVTKTLYSNGTSTEYTHTNGLTAFGTDGFTVGTGGSVNNSSDTFVAWNWKAGGTGSANSVGTINSTVSVNTTAGFSIVTYTGNGVSGATVGHGLGVAPKMIMIKCRNSAHDWAVYHKNLTSNNYYVVLNTTGAAASDTAKWQNTDPSSTVFTLGNGGGVNANTQTHVAYCFAEIPGFSKFGEYRGNETNNNSFIYTGMKPSFILIKNYHSSDNWQLFDNKRIGYNVDNNRLNPNENGAENTNDEIDILSNGFKIRTGSSQALGHNGHKYIYMAFGQSLVGSNNVPCTAR